MQRKMPVGAHTSLQQGVLARICRAVIKHTCWIKNKPGRSGTGEDTSGGDKTHVLDQKLARRKWYWRNIHVASSTSAEEVVLAKICRPTTKHTCWIKNKPGKCTDEDDTSSPVPLPPGLFLIQHVCFVAARHILAGTTFSALVLDATCMFCRCRASF